MALSVVLIAVNEENWIENCLLSVEKVADEIVVVVDSRTTDKTPEIAKRFGAKVFTHDWQGFSAEKNFAFSKATGPWILSIDADERVSKSLAIRIKEIVNAKD